MNRSRFQPDPAEAWTPQRILVLRAMAEEFFDLLETAEPDDTEAGMHNAVMGGALAGFVPDLLDEIERLRRQYP